MAIIIGDKIAFLHIPKTGGMWIRRTLKKNRIPFTPYLPLVSDGGFEKLLIRDAERHHLACVPKSIKRMNTYAVVRNPVDWYRSFYLFRCNSEKWKWHFSRPFDKLVNGPSLESFSEFIYAVKKVFPDGFLYQLYKSYMIWALNIINMDHLSDVFPSIIKKSIEIGPPTNTQRGDLIISKTEIDFILNYESRAMEIVEKAK